MVDQWRYRKWDELSALEQAAVLEELERIGRETMRQRFARARAEGTALPPVHCFNYLEVFGQQPQSNWDPADPLPSFRWR